MKSFRFLVSQFFTFIGATIIGAVMITFVCITTGFDDTAGLWAIAVGSVGFGLFAVGFTHDDDRG